MKIIIFILIYASLSIGQQYTIDIDKSKIFWIGKKVTGEHYGTIKIKEGYINIDNNKIDAGNIVIDMNTIEVLDIEDDKWNKKLETHLKNQDFFDVINFPEANFSINESYDFFMIEDIAIKGKLTIKNQTIDFSIPLVISFKDDYIRSLGVININRTDFGITYGSGTFFKDLTDKAIDDYFTLKFEIIAEKNK